MDQSPGPTGEHAIDFARVFTAQPTAYLVMSPDLVVLDANPAYLELLGRTREELVGRYVFDAFPLAQHPTDTLDALCDALVHELVADRPDDDVALVAVRLHRQDRPHPPEAGPQHVPPGVPAPVHPAP